MSEQRDRLEYVPDEESLVNALARSLSRDTGLEWRGLHKGHSKAVPGAAVFHALRADADGRYVLAGVMLLADIRPAGPGDAITAEMLRKVPVSAMENSRNLNDRDDQVKAELAKLTPLEGADRSDPVAFSRLVADHYRVWARAVPHPAAAMAAQTGVKSPTVHTWIREARLRGLLPPARRGKAS